MPVSSLSELCDFLKAAARPTSVRKLNQKARSSRPERCVPDHRRVTEVAGRGIPVRLNATPPTWPVLRESASAFKTVAFGLKHSTASPAATPSSCPAIS